MRNKNDDQWVEAGLGPLTRVHCAMQGIDPATLPPDPTQTEHLNGIDWIDAPIPPRIHRCKAQTRGWFNYFTRIERCACGAIRRDGQFWFDRNSRR